MRSKQQDPRITELLDLATSEGIRLPYPPETIIRQENAGNTVDLSTGAITIGGDNVRFVPKGGGQC